MFKGDALNVIMVLKGLEKFEDWQVNTNLIKGRTYWKNIGSRVLSSYRRTAIEAPIQTLTIASELKVEKLMFEGDALNVIMALKDLEQFEDWQVKTNLIKGQDLLEKHGLWSIEFVPRDFNWRAHNLAKWGKMNLVSRHLEPALLPKLLGVIGEALRSCVSCLVVFCFFFWFITCFGAQCCLV